MVDISCIFLPAHLPFTLFPRSYLTFPKGSVFHELRVCSAWSLVALASGAWERQEGKRIQSHSFSLCPLSYLGRAWVDLGLRNWSCGHRKQMHEKARNKTGKPCHPSRCKWRGAGAGQGTWRGRSPQPQSVLPCARQFFVGVSSGSLRSSRLGDWGNKMQN